jgi:hypothetical protein
MECSVSRDQDLEFGTQERMVHFINYIICVYIYIYSISVLDRSLNRHLIVDKDH